MDIFMMDLWVYRDSRNIKIVGTHWHFICYSVTVLNVFVWFGERGAQIPLTANPSLLCCLGCDKHWVIMCKTPVKSPVNTGEQPQPETAPSLTETNGQSQPLPEVVPLVSSPAEDRAQPPPEQVAPPTATDVRPELPSSGDIIASYRYWGVQKASW